MLFSKTKMSDFSITSVLLLLIGFITLGFSIYFFIELSRSVLQTQKLAIDQRAFEIVRKTSFSGVGPLAKGVSQAGSVIVMVIVSLLLAGYLLFFSPLSRWVGIHFILAMGGISSLTKGMKSLSDRGRPEFMGDFHGATSSFPSGHASGALVFYGFLIYLIMRSKLEPKWKWLINIALILLIILIGFSRLYIGVHFFTDIIAGYLFGLAWLMICLTALEIILWSRRRR
ncbi:undecaprenyl-diphosphatase [Halobacillus dabanensis]|uniref:Undecaprenyl-diphosphatase n=1 Tax=Halobacillus dabanensis TaxID=240302 RepID=A0A1I3U389_HALDA|nr:phosphatase PAP2 family protein [Halobacillus dabanensis]SFJ76241.1 undecaprenyl-diphosphatase [Halobacillus dabanensis]